MPPALLTGDQNIWFLSWKLLMAELVKAMFAILSSIMALTN